MRRLRPRAAVIAFLVVLAAVGLPGTALAAPPTAQCQIVDDWGTGFQGKCVVFNPPPGPVDGWWVRLCFTPDTVRITQAWNVTASMAGAACATFQSVPWNSHIPDGGSFDFGFIGIPGGAVITSCTINSLPC